jgi:thermostable 8-oxoguanine DNA glycosylase
MTDSSDASKIKTLVEQKTESKFVQNRIRRNVLPRELNLSREVMWRVLIGCLLTTQQKSGPDSDVKRFLEQRPFPLTIDCCDQPQGENLVRKTLTDFGGIRFTNKIPTQAARNLKWLGFGGGWAAVDEVVSKLKQPRLRPPESRDFLQERLAARMIDTNLSGFGPKQSRNFLQWLGLTRFEIPIDSRVAKWINRNLSLAIDESKLSGLLYYESVLDKVRALCEQAGILPCVLDAAIFSALDREWTDEELTE